MRHASSNFVKKLVAMVRNERSKNRDFVFGKHKLLIFLISVIVIALITGITMCVFISIQPIKKRDFRLPTNLVPEHYKLEIQPHLDPGNLKFVGNIEIVFNCREITGEIILHARELEIDEKSLTLQDSSNQNQIEILNIEYDTDIDLLIMVLEKDLQKGNSYTIRLNFGSNFSDNANGFFISTYRDKDNITHYSAVTHFEPISARQAFPCFDEPALKATFDITIVRKRNMISISNMPKKRTQSRESDWEADIYQTSKKMSTYIVAYFIGEYKGKTKDKITVWAPPEYITAADYALEVGPKLLSFYEDLFGIPYALPKLDMVPIFKMSVNAMENWGLIIYNWDSLLYSNYSTYSSHLNTALTVAHELVHQWFGNLVTMEWWNDVWLNEGIATHVTDVALNTLFPELIEDEVIDLQFKILSNYDCNSDVVPVVIPFEKHKDFLDSRFIGNVTYMKGGMITGIIHHILGNETFWRGLSKYLKENAYENVVEDTLWHYLTQAQPTDSPKFDLAEVMRSWTHLKGQPVISVIRNYSDRTAFMEQVSCRVKLSEEHKNDLWNIPIFYTTATERNSTIKTWFKTKKMTLRNLPAKDNWILINEEAIGYYRVNYDRRNWQLLARQLQTNHQMFTPQRRCNLLYDINRFGILNYTDPDVILDFYLYIPYEKDLPVIEYSGFMTLIFLYTNYLEYDKHEYLWKEYMNYLFIPLYGRINWNSNDTEKESQASFQILYYLCCKMNYKNCVDRALEEFEIWKEHKEKWIIPYQFQYTVQCTGVRYGSKKDWNEVYNEYKSQNYDSKWIELLSCSRDKELIRRLLKSLLGENEDYFFVFVAEVILKHEMSLEVFQFFDENFNEIIKDKEKFSKMQDKVISRIENSNKINKLINILEKHLQEVDPEIAEVIEKEINSCIEKISGINRNLKYITKWLREEPWTKDMRQI